MRTVFNTPVATPLFRAISRILVWSTGWRMEGRIPDEPRLVIVGAPHTSAWDLPYGLAFAFLFGLPVQWVGKKEVFRWPFGPFFRWMGGIPVDRSRPQGVVDQIVEQFRASRRLYLIITPEGTRRPVSRWKTGFYRIAMESGTPILLGYLDYGRKTCGPGPCFMPSGNMAADMQRIRDFYADKAPCRSEKWLLPEIPAEGESRADAGGNKMAAR